MIPPRIFPINRQPHSQSIDMASKNQTTKGGDPAAEPESQNEALSALVAAKVAAGLPQRQAVECAKAQLDHDARLAADAKKK